MNDAHLHLLLNHLPIVGLLIGIMVLLAGFAFNKRDVKLTALGIFIFSGVASLFAFFTGEGAEEVVEHFADVSETLIHTHEEFAETFLILSLILGVLSILAWVAELRKMRVARLLVVLVLLLAVGDGVLAKYVGSSGGEVRHTEIRSDLKIISLEGGDSED